MSDQQTAAPENITFEGGYEELKGIVARLGSDDVSVHEMFEGFRRGKGLEKSLRSYLQEREGELTEIEQGVNLPQFNIVAPGQQGGEADEVSDYETPPSGAFARDVPADAGDFQVSRGGSDDDIPF